MNQSPKTTVAAANGGLVSPASDNALNGLTRRRIFAGAGTVGALAAVAAVVPLAQRAAPVPAADQKIAAAAAGGYQVTDHVLRYYQTARV
ncbi:MAG: hypothetical protein ABIN96_03400 [Rubrivivax sp.]